MINRTPPHGDPLAQHLPATPATPYVALEAIRAAAVAARATRTDRAVELLTTLIANPHPSATIPALAAIGFDWQDPAELAALEGARLTVSLLDVACLHSVVSHGCDLTPGQVLRFWALRRQEVRS